MSAFVALASFTALISLSTLLITPAEARSSSSSAGYTLKHWHDLLPKNDLSALSQGRNYLYIPDGSSEDKIESPISMKIEKPRNAYEKALISVGVRSELNNQKIKLPGYIVPVDIQGEGVTKSFFFVPYFGQCLHLPPPPPNQIIFATFPKGYNVDLEQPYYIEMTLRTEQMKNDIARSAYTATVNKITPYQ